MDHNTMINELITIPTLTSFKNDEEKKCYLLAKHLMMRKNTKTSICFKK